MSNELIWVKAEEFLGTTPLHDLLLEKGSLTERLQSLCENFKIKVLSQSWFQPWVAESRALKQLNCKPKQTMFIREVILLGGEIPWVYARTVIPAHTFKKYQPYFANIGNRSLGEILFYELEAQRSLMEIAELQAGDIYLHEKINDYLDSNQKIFARRSLFSLQRDTLLVSEFFTPQLIALL